MRDEFRQQLETTESDLVTMTKHVRNALNRGTESLLTADATAAEEVISGDAVIDEMRERIEEESFDIILRQAPVATDLRQMVSTLRMVSDLERMGDLSVHLAKVARMRFPTTAVPDSLIPTIKQMAATADHMLATTAHIISDRDVSLAEQLEADDDDMDQLRRDMFRILLDAEEAIGTEAAIDMALIGRYYERIGDHAVSMARRVIFLVTGEYPGTAA